MNLKHEINRLSDYFSDGVEKVQTATTDMSGKVRSQACDVTDKALATLRGSTDSLFSAEENLLNHIRKNPAIYIFTGLLLVGAIILKTMWIERAPMRDSR